MFKPDDEVYLSDENTTKRLYSVVAELEKRYETLFVQADALDKFIEPSISPQQELIWLREVLRVAGRG